MTQKRHLEVALRLRPWFVPMVSIVGLNEENVLDHLRIIQMEPPYIPVTTRSAISITGIMIFADLCARARRESII